MSPPTLAFYIALSTVGGILIPIMAALSGALGRTLDTPWTAAPPRWCSPSHWRQAA